MKKTIKKIAAVLFAVVIAVACFAGCSKSGGEHDKANDSKRLSSALWYKQVLTALSLI